jgi:hypothetical protein
LNADQCLMTYSTGNLCVFCDEPMPLNPSSKLKKLGQYLQAKPEVQHRREPTNPWALHLPVSLVILYVIFGITLSDCSTTSQFPLTASYCQMYQAELNIIPHGLAKQWPSTIDFENLPHWACTWLETVVYIRTANCFVHHPIPNLLI